MGDVPIELLLTCIGVLGTWLGFMEKRLQNMSKNFVEKMGDKDKIHEVIQKGLKEDIDRLEHTVNRLEQKIDTLLRSRA